MRACSIQGLCLLPKLFLFMVFLMQNCAASLLDVVVLSPWLQLSTEGSAEVDLKPLDFVALLAAEDASPVFESVSFRLSSGLSMCLSCCLPRVFLTGV